MLTRLKVNGFKNLVDVDIRFGPFTCIAGANGTGKSNLFDAIRFLSALADNTLLDAALSVRDEGSRSGDIRSLFHRVGDQYDAEMSFEAEMIVPELGYDDLGQEAKATITFLRYTLRLAYRTDPKSQSQGAIEILEEKLEHINQRDAYQHLLFDHSQKWRKSAVKGARRGAEYFISTVIEGGKILVRRHQDGGSSGKPLSRLASNLPRTVLSVSNAAESPTALMTRREMQSWRLMQLEPSALRMPDPFTAPEGLGVDGAHLASTLYSLAHTAGRINQGSEESYERAAAAYAQVANRLAELIDDVRDVWVDRDERRELLTLMVTDRAGTSHTARALSDGTLRFLALSILERDPSTQGVICLEEPENGIHPQRIPAMLQLLQDIAVDASEPIGEGNPLRQVIINTHSPSIVQQIPEASLIIAELRKARQNAQQYKRASFGCLPGNWRTKDKDKPPNIVPKALLLMDFRKHIQMT